MQTRSQVKYPIIDFDDASKEWLLNKKKRGNGTYAYICGKPLSSGRLCQRIDGCSLHAFWEKKEFLSKNE